MTSESGSARRIDGEAVETPEDARGDSPSPHAARLAGQEVEFHQLLDGLPAGAYVCDPDGLITYYNRRAVELWGRAPKLNDPEDRYCGSFRLYSAEDGTPIRFDECWMALALREREGYNDREIIIERPDGKRLTVLANANPIRDKAGALVGAVNVLVDITDRKLVEDEQRQLRVALLNRGRLTFAGEMAAGIAHELNQPLTAIANYSEACLSLLRAGQVNGEDLLEAIEQIAEQGQRAADIIRRLRGLVNKAPLQREPVDLSVLVRKTLNYIATTTDAGVDRTRIRVDIADSLPPVAVDAVQIQQVLVNLIRNSIDAMDEPSIDHRELRLLVEPAGDGMVTVTVRDTGRGLGEGVHELLFFPFFTTKPEGIGLGLPISASIIEAHGGRLWAEPNNGPGTTFHFTLPTAGAPERSPDV